MFRNPERRLVSHQKWMERGDLFNLIFTPYIDLIETDFERCCASGFKLKGRERLEDVWAYCNQRDKGIKAALFEREAGESINKASTMVDLWVFDMSDLDKWGRSKMLDTITHCDRELRQWIAVCLRDYIRFVAGKYSALGWDRNGF